MTKIVASALILASALAFTVPASAQGYRYGFNAGSADQAQILLDQKAQSQSSSNVR